MIVIPSDLIRNCKRCKKQFHPTSIHQLFCCTQCLKDERNEHRRLQNKLKKEGKLIKTIRLCAYCGKQIENKTSKKYCDHNCYIMYRRKIRNKSGRINKIYYKPIIKYCLNCGKEIKYISSRNSNYKDKKFCSRKCCQEYFIKNKNLFTKNIRIINNNKITFIKNENNKWIWKFYKNDKLLLLSDEFNTIGEAQNDARKALA